MYDVQDNRTDFTSLLVSDVSRWGRFQDMDESAYYEYVLKRAGIRVHYCASSSRMTGACRLGTQESKAVMAAEYSRELPVRSSLVKAA
jgi:DNA invertase Pin-like site-specific DNA recombinase